MGRFNVIIITFFLAVISTNLIAQNAVIKGYAPGAENKTIKIIKYSDQITYTEKVIASAVIMPTGEFNIELKNIFEPIYAVIDISLYRANIYIEPNTAYEIKIDSADYRYFTDIYNPYLNTPPLNISILNSNEKDLNSLIQDFNYLYNNFIQDKFDSLRRFRSKKIVQDFKRQADSIYSDIKNDYFRSYLNYKMASVEQFSQVISRDSLAGKYFIDKPVLYENIEYMSFLNEFFSGYIPAMSKKITANDIETTINVHNSYKALLDTLGKDTILKNQKLRELVMLKTLGELYNNDNYKKENIRNIIEFIRDNSIFNEHRIIADNLIKILTKLKPGTKAPEFKLKDVNGNIVSLSDFVGKKYVYLVFWHIKCQACLAEMELLNKYKEKYGNDVEIIGISVDNDLYDMKRFLKEKDYKWTVIHYNNDPGLLENYDIKAYPQFVLINKEGNILKYPADYPNSIEPLFMSLVKKSPEKGYKIFEK